MKAIEAENIKSVTGALFLSNVFDGFLVTEASFSVLYDITIEGQINKEFLSEGEEPAEDCVSWGQIREYCFNFIKGKKTPLKFKIVFRMPNSRLKGFISKYGLNFAPEDINALFLNVIFDGGGLKFVTGTSMKTFTMDRSLDEAWDVQMTKFISNID